MDLCVVDASVVINRVVASQSMAADARSLFARLDDNPPLRMVAPDLLYAECANALWKYVRFAGADGTVAAAHLRYILRLQIEVMETPLLVERALELAGTHGTNVYDACYVALAESAGCPLVTADQPLVRRLAGAAISVQWLGAL